MIVMLVIVVLMRMHKAPLDDTAATDRPDSDEGRVVNRRDGLWGATLLPNSDFCDDGVVVIMVLL